MAEVAWWEAKAVAGTPPQQGCTPSWLAAAYQLAVPPRLAAGPWLADHPQLVAAPSGLLLTENVAQPNVGQRP